MLDQMIDEIFRIINIPFVQQFKVGNNISTRISFIKYYIPLVEMKNFNELIDNKPIFNQLLENKQKGYESLSKYQETMVI